MIDALQSYDVKAIPWSRREDVVAEMTAYDSVNFGKALLFGP